MDWKIQIFTLFVLSLAVASIAWTVTQEEIFREWHDICVEKSKSCRGLLARKFFYVFTCEYCFSHWVGLIVIATAQFRLLFDDWRGYVLAFFIVPWFANQWMSLYRRLRVDIKKENAVAEKLEKENNGS